MESIEKNTWKEPEEPFRRTILKWILKAGIAAGIIGFLFYSAGDKAEDWFAKMENLRWQYLIPACLLYAFHLFANAWRWHLLLKVRNIPCSLAEACSLTMQSFFFSLVMPGGAVGGDVVRAGFLARALPKERIFDGIFTILMDRFTGMLGIFLLALLTLPLTWWCVGTAGGYANIFILFLLAGAFAGAGCACIVFCHRKLERFGWYRKLRSFADRFSGGLFTKVEEALDCYRKHGKVLAVCVIASILAVNLVLAGVMYFVCLCFVPAPEVAVTAALGAVTVGNIAGLIPATPSGIGMRDYFIMTILAAASFPADPLLPAILMTLVISGFNLAGGLFFLLSKHPGRKNEMPSGESGKPAESDI